MKHIILYITSSIDGYIAEAGGNLDFLQQHPACNDLNSERKAFLGSVDTVIMGGRTYREMQSMDIIWPYMEQTTYVVSHYDWGEKENIKFITADIIETIKKLRRQPGKDILLAGGGKIASILLGAGLIDEMRIFYIPVTLGRGISLFPEQPACGKWRLETSKVYANGILAVSYLSQDTRTDKSDGQ